jgi:hypothetical protein
MGCRMRGLSRPECQFCLYPTWVVVQSGFLSLNFPGQGPYTGRPGSQRRCRAKVKWEMSDEGGSGVNRCLVAAVIAGLLSSLAFGWSDSFEDGVINTALWDADGSRGGGGAYSNVEIIASDGYLQARAKAHVSWRAYGAQAWIRAKQDFNDGQSHLIDFKWQTDVRTVNMQGADLHAIEITDGRTNWPGGLYLWNYPSHQMAGTVQLYQTNGANLAATRWSIVIDGQGKTATLYGGPHATGGVRSICILDPSLPWYIRFITVVGAIAGFPVGPGSHEEDCSLNLYDFAVDESTPLIVPVMLGWSDDFEDGVVNTAFWDADGSEDGHGGFGGFSATATSTLLTSVLDLWDAAYSNVEIIASDGYLQARAKTPKSECTEGAQAWIRTKQDFNDGKSHLIDFKWQADVRTACNPGGLAGLIGQFSSGSVDTANAELHAIEITDGRTNWPGGLYLWCFPGHQMVGTVQLYQTNGANLAAACWSIVIDGQGKTATLYGGPNATGEVRSICDLDPSLHWYVRFITVVGTGPHFSAAKDCSLNLYDFAVDESTPLVGQP